MGDEANVVFERTGGPTSELLTITVTETHEVRKVGKVALRVWKGQYKDGTACTVLIPDWVDAEFLVPDRRDN